MVVTYRSSTGGSTVVVERATYERTTLLESGEIITTSEKPLVYLFLALTRGCVHSLCVTVIVLNRGSLH